MAAYCTCRGIPLPRSLAPLARRAQQPPFPPPRPGTYGNAAWPGRWPEVPGTTAPPPQPRQQRRSPPPLPRFHATAATRATNVRALAPSGVSAPQSPTASTSSSPSASSPHASGNSPHRQHAANATRTTGVPAPSGAGAPQSPRQERASKQVAQRHQPQHHTATAIREHRASPAKSGALPSPTNTAAVGTQPEQAPGNAHQQMGPASGPYRRPGSTIPNTTGRFYMRLPAGRPPGSGDTGPTGAPPTPRHTKPALAGPRTCATRKPPQTVTYRYPDRHHQHPALQHRAPPSRQPHLALQSPGSRDTRRIGPGGPLAGPGTSRIRILAAPRPTSRAGSAAHRNIISQPPGPQPRREPRPGPGTRHRPG